MPIKDGGSRPNLGKEGRVTKADIVERLYERVGLPKQEVSDVVESVFELIKGRLEKGEKVKISGFGLRMPTSPETTTGSKRASICSRG